MEKIVFEAKGMKIEFKGNQQEAMAKANAFFGALPQGAWMVKGAGFYWAEGNFFD